MTAPTVRVLVLDGSPSRRQRLQRLLEADAALEVVATAGTADQAIASAARRQADVIVLGQGSNPVQAIEWTRGIMQARATPIVVVTAAVSPVEERQAFALMEAGALAVLRDPGPATTPQHEAGVDSLLTSVRLMAEVKVVRRWAATAAGHVQAPPVPRQPRVARSDRGGVELVAIGASTGGPVALRQVLGALPAGFPAPIVIVQHMADGFLHGLADWLSATCAVPTQMAVVGTVLQPGRAYLAPDGAHLRVAPGWQLEFDAGPPVHGHRPAVACLFGSAAQHYGRRAIGILLTGMGRDGAEELKQMKDAGALTIAQDEASSVVHGMPGQAIRCGGASHVMSPDEIGAALPALVQR